ncbi:SLBB domain-containing protein [Caenimonas sedimenti]|nr:SLBB domain-containing protein [Caenimonas sedimenti]
MHQQSTIRAIRTTPLAMRAARWAACAALCWASALAFAQVSEEGLRLSPSSDLSSRGMQDYISTGAAPISIRSQALPAQQSIRIDAGQRVEVPTGGNVPGPGVNPNAPYPGQVSDEAAAQNRSRSEFQQLIFKTRGRDIEHYGLSLFGAPPTTFSLADRIAPPANYMISPGDEIRIRAWGQVDMDFVASVEKTGLLYIPIVGAVPVGGVSFQELKGLIRNRLARTYKGFDLDVSLGAIHTMQVFVTGRAAKPGAYTLGGLASLVNAVFAVGGPAENGSMRKIVLRRNNVVVTELDLYDFIARGDKSKDVRLQSGDVIYFPPALGYAAIAGSVQNPAIYELTPRTNLKELIDLAGGLSTTARAGRVVVERIENRQSRVVAEFTTEPAQTARLMQDGDVVQINPISPRFENEVTLRGHVPETQRLPFTRGMRVTDVVPNQMALLAHQYWQVRNEKGRGFHWLLDKPATGGRVAANQPPGSLEAMVQRQPVGPADRSMSGYAQQGAASRDAEDRLRRPQTEAATPPGRVRTYNGTEGPSGDEPIYRSGLPPAAPRPDMLDELARGNQDIYWDYASIERFDPATLRTVLIPFHLGRAIVERDPSENKLLEPGDVITVFSQRDIRVPVAKQAQYVRIEGEVARPGVYQIAFGQPLANVIAQAGGLTENAYVYGTELVREETRQLQQQELDNLVDRLGESLERSASTRLRESLDGGGAGAPDASAALLDAQRRLVRKLRLVQASGRILLDAEAVGEPGRLQPDKLDIVLQDGDRVYIPARPSTVIVLGAVNRPNAMVYRPGRSAQDYIALAGGATRNAASREVLVARANGSVQNLHGGSGGWFSGETTTILPGDTILVPEDTDAFTSRRIWRDWTQIIYQGALGVAGLRLLSDVFTK